MTAHVNLIPDDCLQTWKRARRRNAWVGIAVGLGFVLCGAAFARTLTRSAVQGVEARLTELDNEVYVVEQQLEAANAERAEYVRKLRVVAGLHQPQPWPAHLARLFEAAPEGVVLTSLALVPTADDPAAAPAAAPRASTKRAASEPDGSASDQAKSVSVKLAGLATNHAQLVELIESLRELERWESVDLTKAMRRDYSSGMVYAFEIECRVAEELP